jgi:predicted nucleic acid-binding protein
MNNILIDTNVLVYALDADSKFHEKSKSLVENENHNLFTTSKNLSELLVVLTRGPEVSISIDRALTIR